MVRLISYPPGMKTSTSPSPLCFENASAARSQTGGALVPRRRGRYSMSTGKVRPSEFTTTQGFKYFSRAPASRVADIASEFHAHFQRHTRSQQSRRKTPRLEDHHPAAREKSVLQQHLRHLCGFPRTGRRLQNKPPRLPQRGGYLIFNFVNGELIG